MNNFMMKISNIIPEWLLKYLKKREIESEEVNFKVTKAIHFLSSCTFFGFWTFHQLYILGIELFTNPRRYVNTLRIKKIPSNSGSPNS